MPTYFIHLENALKRANEFIEVSNKNRALEILCDVLHSKKHRTWQKKHEEIMMKYLELCVELKQSYVAKEGIYQYKIICQQSYIGSFEDVIRKYIAMAEEKANQAKEESTANIAEIEDLENAQTPQDILMSAVSNEGNQDRKDRVVLIPWVKFLWESYRQCLDLLRHNNKTERLYHDIAHQAFKFCIKYNRKAEFRKLCDHLHLHLDQLKRQQSNPQTPQQQANTINLNAPETQALHLETRLIQLDNAIQLELWQEAYKATDDIKKFNLMNLNKKGFGKPQLIASYYQKLSLVFWKASSNLFHAAAQFRLFHLSKDLRKNLSSDDVQKMASRLVLSVLSIPIPAIRPEIDKLVDTEENVIDQHHRNLSMLLGITSKPPTRASLIKDLKRMGVLPYASAPIQELYQLLEVEFNPMGICGRVNAIIEYLEKSATAEKPTELPEVVQYIPVLKEVTIIRLIREVSQVYRTIEFQRLAELCPFADKVALEKYMVESARRHDLQVRIDHRLGCYIFGTELRVSTGDEVVEGPYLQSMPNEQMRRQLVSMYSSLQKALHLIEPDALKKQREDLKRQAMKTYYAQAKEEHHRLLSRQNIIEKRKEMIEQQGLQREMNERRRVEEEETRKREAEEARLAEENKERERKRREKDEAELMKQMTMDQLKKMKDAMPDLKLDDLDDEELAKLKPQDLHIKRVEQLEKERRDALNKQKKVERKVDHFERAKRIEELPLLAAQYEEWRVVDRQIWDQCELLRIEADKEARGIALKERERFRRVEADKKDFTERVLATRQTEFAERIADFDAMVAEERKKRLAARREKRIEERRVRYNKEKEATRLAAQAEAQKRKLAEIEERMRAMALENKNLDETPAGGSAFRNAPKLSAAAEEGGLMWRKAPRRIDDSGAEPPPLRGAASAGGPAASSRDEDIPLPAILMRANRPEIKPRLPPVEPVAATESSSTLDRRPRDDQDTPRPAPPQTQADQASGWRRAGPAPDSSDTPRPYSGRISDDRRGAGPPRDGRDDRRVGRDGDEGPPRDGGRRPYGGRDSDRGGPRDDGDRPRYGGRDSRDRDGASGPRGPPSYGGDRRREDRDFDRPRPMSDRRDRDREGPPGPARSEGAWRSRTAGPPQPEQDRPAYRGRDSRDHEDSRGEPRRPRPAAASAEDQQQQQDGGEDDGWMKVDHSHARKDRPSDRSGPGRFDRNEGPPRRPAYGGRDSRDNNEPPPNPRGPPRGRRD